ncbi:hypothetical protein QEJ31_10940 [Pigmentibacter sp. JX0631]|uniref:hypothetical protein n=1 Tax=Pigmentibacter sp. JX0631 TaxID=2976982 RepID=UPI00246993D1|nr:hypothetical protein [Pigmentibacter sp. JX0631]WGL59034.1 hypothetical protein QEJ31_10940 [Pigmentibacter sp. JX0631]
MYLKYFPLLAMCCFQVSIHAQGTEQAFKRSKRSVVWNLPDQFFKTLTMNNQSLCLTKTDTNNFECFSLYANQLKLPPEQQKNIGKFKKVTVGERHVCGLGAEDNLTYCWGSNENGQLATGGTENLSQPTKVFTSTNFTHFALGFNNTFALDDSGKIWGWGSNKFGQLGYFNYDLNSYYPYQISNDDDKYFLITAGDDFFCSISEEGEDSFGKYGKIYCLGKGYSQVETEETLLDTANEFLKLSNNNYYSISSSMYHTCAINKQRKIECWGENKYGQVGLNPLSNAYVLRPFLVTHPTDSEFNNSQFKSIVTTPNATCGTTDTNKTYCFGDNTFGQLGYKLGNEAIKEENGFRYSIQYFPKKLDKNSDVINKSYVSLAGNSRTLCGLTQQQELECWGFTEKNYFKEISLGDDFYCGLSFKGTRALCGSTKKSNDNHLTHPWNTTVQFPWVSKEEFIQVSSGEFAVCGITSENVNNTYCAFNKKTPFFTDKFKFKKVNLPNSSLKIAVGDSHVCAIQKDNGQIYCSGNNAFGQLGIGSFRSTKYAVEFKPIVNPLKIQFKDLALSGRTTCGLSVTNEVYCFGSNEYGEMGSTLIASMSKTTLHKIKDLKLKTIVAGNKHFCGVTLDDTENKNKLYCWGDNSFGQVGKQNIADPYQNNNIHLPFEVPNTQKVVSVTASEHTTCFLNKNNETYCLGKDLENVFEERSLAFLNHIPYQVQKNNSYTSISLGKKIACGILKTDKTINCWGMKN